MYSFLLAAVFLNDTCSVCWLIRWYFRGLHCVTCGIPQSEGALWRKAILRIGFSLRTCSMVLYYCWEIRLFQDCVDWLFFFLFGPWVVCNVIGCLKGPMKSDLFFPNYVFPFSGFILIVKLNIIHQSMSN